MVQKTHLKNTPIQHVHNRVAKDLMTALGNHPLDDAWGKTPKLLLWILFMGTYGTTEKGRFEWFLERLADGLDLLRYGNWMDIRNKLKQHPYINKEFDQPFEHIWRLATGRRSPS